MRTIGGRLGLATRIVLSVALGHGLAAATASASPVVVYGSYDDVGTPIPGGIYPLLNTVDQPIGIGMVGSATLSDPSTTPCAGTAYDDPPGDPSGGEVCGIQFTVWAMNGATLGGLTPDSQWAAWDEMRVLPTTTQLTGQAFVLSAVPPTTAPRKLGVLKVTSVGSPGAYLWVEGEAIGPDLSTTTVTTAIFAPEPGFATGLVSGVMALGVLAHRRRRRV
jgi:hypothetical protein